MFDELAYQRERHAALKRVAELCELVDTLIVRHRHLIDEVSWWRNLAITSALLSAGTFGLVGYHLW